MQTLLALHGSGRDETDLVEFCHQLAMNAHVSAPRGPFAQSNGFTFFRRRPDRSIDADEVVDLAKRWAILKLEAYLPTRSKMVLVGYSSGAIFAEALLSVVPEKFAGAVLLRPEPLSQAFEFPAMPAKPVLILAGKHDEQRRPDDAAVLAEQLENAEAAVSLRIIDAGHGWASDGADLSSAKSWLAAIETV